MLCSQKVQGIIKSIIELLPNLHAIFSPSFRYRARAIPKVKGNYKQSHSDLSCTMCSSNLEMNQEHLDICDGIVMGLWIGEDCWTSGGKGKKLGATVT